jgi:hypothetical protein
MICTVGFFSLVTAGCGDDGEGDGSTSADTDPGGTTGGPTSSSTNPSSSGTTTDPGTTTEPDTTTEPGTTTDGESSGSSGEPGEMAEIRVLHLGVNAPAVDVFANGEGPVVEALEFRNGTAYLSVPAGDYTFEVSVSGSGPEDAVLAPMLTLDADTKYTAVAIGDLEETDGAPGLQALPLVDDDEGIDAANVRITVVHAAPAVGQVDIWEISDPENPVALLEDVDFGASATLPDIPAGALEIGVDVDDDEVPDVTFSIPDAGLGGLQVNAYANNDADGNVALVAQLPDGTVLPIAAN